MTDKARFENKKAKAEVINCAADGGGHEYAEKLCPKCGVEFCYACCLDTNVQEGGKHHDDYMLCPSCGHDYYSDDPDSDPDGPNEKRAVMVNGGCANCQHSAGNGGGLECWHPAHATRDDDGEEHPYHPSQEEINDGCHRYEDGIAARLVRRVHAARRSSRIFAAAAIMHQDPTWWTWWNAEKALTAEEMQKAGLLACRYAELQAEKISRLEGKASGDLIIRVALLDHEQMFWSLYKVGDGCVNRGIYTFPVADHPLRLAAKYLRYNGRKVTLVTRYTMASCDPGDPAGEQLPFAIKKGDGWATYPVVEHIDREAVALATALNRAKSALNRAEAVIENARMRYLRRLADLAWATANNQAAESNGGFPVRHAGAVPLEDPHNACNPESDHCWTTLGIKQEISRDKTIVYAGKINWDFSGVENVDLIDDAGSYPWDDESLVDFQAESEWDFSDPDQVEEFLEWAEENIDGFSLPQGWDK